jgi:hypothetical protein
MSDIKHVLQPGETVRYEGSTHWMLYFPAILLAAAGLVGLILTWGASQPYGILVALACLIIAFVLAVRAWPVPVTGEDLDALLFACSEGSTSALSTLRALSMD